MLASTCSVITNILVQVYGLTVSESNFANMIYNIMYVPGNFLAIAVYNKWGLKVCIVFGALLLLVGAWVRLFIIVDRNILYYYIGSIIAALG